MTNEMYSNSKFRYCKKCLMVELFSSNVNWLPMACHLTWLDNYLGSNEQ